MLKYLLVIIGVAVGGLLLARPAAAHAVLEETIPPDGAVLAHPPGDIVLRFNEPVAPIAVTVLDRTGRPVATEVRADNAVLRIALPPALPDGGYVVSYRVTSLDTHPVSGAFLFAVGQAPADWQAAATDESGMQQPWQIAVVINQVLHYAGLLGAAGGALFLALVTAGIGPDVRRDLHAAIGLAAATALLGLGLTGAELEDAPLAGLLDPAVWRLGATSTLGASVAVTLGGLLVLAVGLGRLPRLDGRAASLTGAVLAVLGFALTGHAATAAPRWLMAPALALHTLMVAYWAGALWPLLRVLGKTAPRAAAPAVQRFSRLAVPAVGLLVLAGLVLATVQVESFAALVATAYGRILLVKLGLVAALMLIAAHNRLRLTPALAVGSSAARHRLRQAIRLEMAVVAAVFVATALLGQTPPPRAHAEHHQAHGFGQANAGGYHTVVTDGQRRSAHVSVEPAVAGRNRLTVHLMSSDGKPLAPLSVSVELSLPAAGIAPIKRKLVQAAPGQYRLDGPEFAVAGRWVLRIDALVSDFEKTMFTAELDIRPANQ